MAIPLIVMTVLFICMPSLIGSVGFLMLISGAIAIAQAFYAFKVGQGPTSAVNAGVDGAKPSAEHKPDEGR